MARSRQAASYAQAPYGQLDAAFCDLMDRLEALDVRRDVQSTARRAALRLLTQVWPSTHYSKRDRDRWTHKATAAFQVSERELAELAGYSQKRAHNALATLLKAGAIVELAPANHRGEGRGTSPATYAFKCHLTQSTSPKKSASASVSSDSRGTDQPQTAQWRL